MTLTTERETKTEAVVADRRRPGRLDRVSPELISVLRTSEIDPALVEDVEFDDQDQLGGMRGILSGLALSVPLWVGIAYVGRWLLS